MITERLKARFWEKVQKKDEGCWGWSGATVKGYGTIGRGKRGEGNTLAHRLSWEIVNGPIPDNINVLHSCDNPPCTNPEHLFLGNHEVNMQDMSGKGRAARGNKQPHSKLTPSQVLEIRSIIAQRSVVNVRAAFGSDDRFTEIAKKFGASEATIRDIHKRRIWKHI